MWFLHFFVSPILKSSAIFTLIHEIVNFLENLLSYFFIHNSALYLLALSLFLFNSLLMVFGCTLISFAIYFCLYPILILVKRSGALASFSLKKLKYGIIFVRLTDYTSCNFLSFVVKKRITNN